MTINDGGKGGQKDTSGSPNEVIIRVKQGTAKALGLDPLSELPEGKTGKNGVKYFKRGAKGTKSFTLVLKTPTEVGGVTVKTVDLPVPSSLSVTEFYKYAFANLKTKINGFISDDGMSYMWDSPTTTTTP
ncbi:hypothetical protein [Floridanema evergladense]|uniref:Uncharacterized protein n=1 Tax=Floridaenema evergladense BLCC-F167 TaxID=3153639 RepID=A0ABV4WEI4_9CYAN